MIFEGKVIRNLVVLAQNYLSPWKRKGTIPDLQQVYSYKELHSRLANHEDLLELTELTITGEGIISNFPGNTKDRQP